MYQAILKFNCNLSQVWFHEEALLILKSVQGIKSILTNRHEIKPTTNERKQNKTYFSTTRIDMG